MAAKLTIIQVSHTTCSFSYNDISLLSYQLYCFLLWLTKYTVCLSVCVSVYLCMFVWYFRRCKRQGSGSCCSHVCCRLDRDSNMQLLCSDDGKNRHSPWTFSQDIFPGRSLWTSPSLNQRRRTFPLPRSILANCYTWSSL